MVLSNEQKPKAEEQLPAIIACITKLCGQPGVEPIIIEERTGRTVSKDLKDTNMRGRPGMYMLSTIKKSGSKREVEACMTQQFDEISKAAAYWAKLTKIIDDLEDDCSIEAIHSLDKVLKLPMWQTFKDAVFEVQQLPDTGQFILIKDAAVALYELIDELAKSWIPTAIIYVGETGELGKRFQSGGYHHIIVKLFPELHKTYKGKNYKIMLLPVPLESKQQAEQCEGIMLRNLDFLANKIKNTSKNVADKGAGWLEQLGTPTDPLQAVLEKDWTHDDVLAMVSVYGNNKESFEAQLDSLLSTVSRGELGMDIEFSKMIDK